MEHVRSDTGHRGRGLGNMQPGQLAAVMKAKQTGLMNQATHTSFVEPITAITRVSRSPVAGMGLFATQTLQPGTTVASFRAGAVMHPKEWKVYHKVWGLPFDAGIEVGSSKIHYDPTWHKGDEFVPKWYRINHQAQPNAVMQLRGDLVVWIARRQIQPNEELSFRYQGNTKAWDSQRVAEQQRNAGISQGNIVIGKRR